MYERDAHEAMCVRGRAPATTPPSETTSSSSERGCPTIELPVNDAFHA